MIFGPATREFRWRRPRWWLLRSTTYLNVPYAFNRKEAKDHGEGGKVVGTPLRGVY